MAKASLVGISQSMIYSLFDFGYRVPYFIGKLQRWSNCQRPGHKLPAVKKLMFSNASGMWPMAVSRRWIC